SGTQQGSSPRFEADHARTCRYIRSDPGACECREREYVRQNLELHVYSKATTNVKPRGLAKPLVRGRLGSHHQAKPQVYETAASALRLSLTRSVRRDRKSTRLNS